MTFPKGVHVVDARGHTYFYYQAGRGTTHQGPRIKLPDDPHSAEFWTALGRHRGSPARREPTPSTR